MPACHVVFYQEKDGTAPALDWLKKLRSTDAKAFTKCRAALARLALLGHELRIRWGSVNYRLLYFFHGRAVSVVAHGLTKEAAVPGADINRAIACKSAFVANPAAHTFTGEIENA